MKKKLKKIIKKGKKAVKTGKKLYGWLEHRALAWEKKSPAFMGATGVRTRQGKRKKKRKKRRKRK